MFIYFCIIILIFILHIVSLNFDNWGKRLTIFFIVFLATIMPGLRDITIGTDTSYYVNMFQRDLSYSEWFDQGIEIGFVTLIKLFQFFGVDKYWIILTFFSLLFNFLVITSIYKMREGVLFSLISFFTFSFIYILQFNVLRQALALSFFIYSIPYILKNENKKAYFFIFLAFSFHVSAIILFVMPYLKRKLENNFFKYICISTLLIFIYGFLSKYIINYMVLFTGASRYENYLDRVDGDNLGLSLLFILYSGLFILATIFFRYTNLNKNNEFKFFFFLLYLSILLNFSIIFLGLPYEGVGRIVLYCTVSYIFIFSYMINQLKKDYYVFFSFMTCMLMLIFFAIIFNFTKFHGVFPYSFNTYLN